ncbi:MAG: LysR substrate-binding domain-containing protein [Pseudomonadota bacterium]|nr:LysR substrate-binding domain-containing protein [Pseudomonadota bacterium]
MLRRAEELQESILKLRTDITNEAATGGTVRLATMEGIASQYLAPRFAGLRETHPLLHVELVTSPQTIRVTRREADLFLSFFRPPDRGLVSGRIGGFSTGLYAPPSYLARYGTPAVVTDLSAHAFVGYIEGLVQVDAVRWQEELVPRSRLLFTSNSMISQAAAAAGGLGIVALPSFAVGEASGLVRVPKTLHVSMPSRSTASSTRADAGLCTGPCTFVSWP